MGAARRVRIGWHARHLRLVGGLLGWGAAFVAFAQAPELADFLPKPALTAPRAPVPCSREPLRRADDLPGEGEAGLPQIGLLRSWGVRQIGFVGEPSGCVDWTVLVGAWQATTGARVDGKLSATDLNRLQEARMQAFPRYREALAAWQDPRIASLANPGAKAPEPPTAEDLQPRVRDSIVVPESWTRRLAGATEALMSLECEFAERSEQTNVCMAALATGRLQGANLARAHFLVAVHYLFENDHARCLMHATRSIEANPKAPRAYLLRGNAYRDLGDLKRAQIEVDMALGLAQGDREEQSLALSERAILMAKAGNYRAAQVDNDEALRLNPKNETAQKNQLPIRQRLY